MTNDQEVSRRPASAKILRDALLGSARDGTVKAFLASLSETELRFIYYDWSIWARNDQLPPPIGSQEDSWTTWLILGGRGAGKTRSGAEWVRAQALQKIPYRDEFSSPRIALIGESLSDVRAIMIEGISGLLAIHPAHERPTYESSKRRLIWPNGAVAQIFSADDPESLRGPQFTAAWCDELAKWRYGEKCWDMLQFGLRLGARPQQVVTTTPRSCPLLKRLLEDPQTVTSRATTQSNAANLAPAFLQTIVKRYHGTRLGRQELDGEILEDRTDALWSRMMLEAGRVDIAPALTRIVVAIDPPVTSGPKSDACGIIAAAQGENGRAYILADKTIEQASPIEWAKAAVSAFHAFEADCLIAEVNQGGELVQNIVHQVDPTLSVRMVRASRGKWLRAEPVAALYEQNRISHVGSFPQLEDQMCDFGRDGLSTGRSPDRVDALVWAVSELMLASHRTPRIRSL